MVRLRLGGRFSGVPRSTWRVPSRRCAYSANLRSGPGFSAEERQQSRERDDCEPNEHKRSAAAAGRERSALDDRLAERARMALDFRPAMTDSRLALLCEIPLVLSFSGED